MIKKTIPKDLSKIKSKVFLNLTKRQILCFTPAVLIGVPLLFATKDTVGNSAATLLMILAMLPFFLMAMYEHNGEPLESYMRHLIRTKFLRDKVRPYRTKNFYACLMEQAELDKEVEQIVSESRNKRRKKTKCKG